MLIKNVFNNLDDAIAYMKGCGACGAAVDRLYYNPDEDGYHVSVIVNDFKFYELPQEARKKVACGAGGVEEYRLKTCLQPEGVCDTRQE